MAVLSSVFIIGLVFPFVIVSCISASCRHLFIWSVTLSRMNVNSGTRTHICHHGLAFFNLIFFNVVLSESMCICAFGLSSSSSDSFAIFHWAFFAMSFSLPYFTPKLFSFTCIWSLVCFCTISPYVFVEFSFVVLACPVLSELFYSFSIKQNSVMCSPTYLTSTMLLPMVFDL